ncbi:membrane steroid-binding protein 1 [Phtheirospermum japonicum]|uniref:Membrane steroid-binding protein 1 n=1 Tax=Phtheirospermum japonicum TaxID=374723 RepID=A0A830BS19_9LAMI|nr:membrane steroid-binding protein 1 [Phtheirospermum japonicum]
MALELWETLKESIHSIYRPLSSYFLHGCGRRLYPILTSFRICSGPPMTAISSRGREVLRKQVEPLPPPVQLGEVTAEELKQYDGSDPQKPLLMAIKGQIYDVTQSRMFYGPGGPYALFAGKDASRALAKMSFEDKDLNGDLTGLGVFELEALQDWEYKFMGKYVKVGTVKTTVPVTDGPSEGQAAEASQSDAAKPADGEVAKPAEEGPSETAAPKETEENDSEKKD